MLAFVVNVYSSFSRSKYSETKNGFEWLTTCALYFLLYQFHPHTRVSHKFYNILVTYFLYSSSWNKNSPTFKVEVILLHHPKPHFSLFFDSGLILTLFLQNEEFLKLLLSLGCLYTRVIYTYVYTDKSSQQMGNWNTFIFLLNIKQFCNDWVLCIVFALISNKTFLFVSGMVNNASIDWFFPWPEQALSAVAKVFISADVSIL